MDRDSDQNQLLEISINHKGEDVIAVVTLAEANFLMNDEAAAAEYAEAILMQQAPGQAPLELLTPDCESRVQECSEKKHDNFNTKQATLLFLKLRTRYNDKFNDRKTLKNSLWQKIAIEMRSNGFDIPEGREGAEKCRQKFANLQRGYMNYIKTMQTTGTGKRDPPPYFQEINAILGSKNKVNPPYLEDSLDTSMDADGEPMASCSSSSNCRQIELENGSVDTEDGSQDESTASSSSSLPFRQREIKNRFSTTNTSIRPTSNLNKVLEVIKQQHQEVREDKAKYMKLLENAINVQNDQRERFLEFLQKTEKRKKRRSSSSSDE